MADGLEVFTIGHSTMPFERFVDRLQGHRVTAVADVRSVPASRHFEQFNRKNLKSALADVGVAYVFLGDELGGRPRDPSLFIDGIADYEKMALTPAFQNGIQRVVEGAKKYRIALMCSEHDPMDCHRCLLVGRALKERGATCSHILSDGSVVTQAQIEDQLFAHLASRGGDLFASPIDQISDAYRKRSLKVAYRLPGTLPENARAG